MITTITGKNQITLPAELVRALGLEPGMRLDWALGPDRTLIATPKPSRAQLIDELMGSGRKYLRPGDDPIADLIAERVAEDEDEEAQYRAQYQT